MTLPPISGFFASDIGDTTADSLPGLIWRTIPCPTLADDDVLIKVAAAGVNRPDIFQRQGVYPPPPGASDILGLEVSGWVEAIGRNVSHFRPGDPVCALLPGGGYANYAIAHQNCCLPTSDALPLPHWAAIPETYFTVWRNVMELGQLRAGETLLVHGGTSGIGSTAIQIARHIGARVCTTVGSAEKAACAKSLGADCIINYKTQDFVAEVKAFTKNAGVHMVLDMVGGTYIQKNISCLAPQGRHISIAFLQGAKVQLNMMPVMLKNLTLTGSTLRAQPLAIKKNIRDQLQHHIWPALNTGKVRPIIHNSYPLADAHRAHADMLAGNVLGKAILIP
jgi:putative PIG3 family NAD(P)H quinone oxidoreductase